MAFLDLSENNNSTLMNESTIDRFARKDNLSRLPETIGFLNVTRDDGLPDFIGNNLSGVPGNISISGAFQNSSFLNATNGNISFFRGSGIDSNLNISGDFMNFLKDVENNSLVDPHGNNSLSEEDENYTTAHSYKMSSLFMTLSCLLVILSLFGNSCVFMTVNRRQTNLKDMFHLLAINLAAADFVLGLLYTFYQLWRLTYRVDFLRSGRPCEVVVFVDQFLEMEQVATGLLMCLDCHHVVSRRRRTWVKMDICISWTVCFLLSLLLATVTSITWRDDTGTRCSWGQGQAHFFRFHALLMAVFIASTVLVLWWRFRQRPLVLQPLPMNLRGSLKNETSSNMATDPKACSGDGTSEPSLGCRNENHHSPSCRSHLACDVIHSTARQHGEESVHADCSTMGQLHEKNAEELEHSRENYAAFAPHPAETTTLPLSSLSTPTLSTTAISASSSSVSSCALQTMESGRSYFNEAVKFVKKNRIGRGGTLDTEHGDDSPKKEFISSDSSNNAGANNTQNGSKGRERCWGAELQQAVEDWLAFYGINNVPENLLESSILLSLECESPCHDLHVRNLSSLESLGDEIKLKANNMNADRFRSEPIPHTIRRGEMELCDEEDETDWARNSPLMTMTSGVVSPRARGLDERRKTKQVDGAAADKEKSTVNSCDTPPSYNGLETVDDEKDSIIFSPRKLRRKKSEVLNRVDKGVRGKARITVQVHKAEQSPSLQTLWHGIPAKSSESSEMTKCDTIYSHVGLPSCRQDERLQPTFEVCIPEEEEEIEDNSHEMETTFRNSEYDDSTSKGYVNSGESWTETGTNGNNAPHDGNAEETNSGISVNRKDYHDVSFCAERFEGQGRGRSAGRTAQDNTSHRLSLYSSAEQRFRELPNNSILDVDKAQNALVSSSEIHKRMRQTKASSSSRHYVEREHSQFSPNERPKETAISPSSKPRLNEILPSNEQTGNIPSPSDTSYATAGIEAKDVNLYDKRCPEELGESIAISDRLGPNLPALSALCDVSRQKVPTDAFVHSVPETEDDDTKADPLSTTIIDNTPDSHSSRRLLTYTGSSSEWEDAHSVTESRSHGSNHSNSVSMALNHHPGAAAVNENHGMSNFGNQSVPVTDSLLPRLEHSHSLRTLYSMSIGQRALLAEIGLYTDIVEGNVLLDPSLVRLTRDRSNEPSDSDDQCPWCLLREEKRRRRSNSNESNWQSVDTSLKTLNLNDRRQLDRGQGERIKKSCKLCCEDRMKCQNAGITASSSTPHYDGQLCKSRKRTVLPNDLDIRIRRSTRTYLSVALVVILWQLVCWVPIVVIRLVLISITLAKEQWPDFFFEAYEYSWLGLSSLRMAVQPLIYLAWGRRLRQSMAAILDLEVDPTHGEQLTNH